MDPSPKFIIAMGPPSTRFKALYLPPPPEPFVVQDDQRTDLRHLDAFTGTLNKSPPSATTPGLLEVLERDLASLHRTKDFLGLPKQRAYNWVQSTLKMFRKLYLLDPDEWATFFILSPEFALNGHRAKDGAPIMYDAGAPVYQELEEYITERIVRTIEEDPILRFLRIVFAFSMVTYEPIIVPPDSTRKTNPFVTPFNSIDCFTIAANNRITVIANGATPPYKRVHKHVPDNVDGWYTTLLEDKTGMSRPVFSQKFQWEAGQPLHTKRIKTPDRPQELIVELPWRGGDGQWIRLAFGTCFDAFNDIKHGVCNLVVFLAGGFPTDNVADLTHPFIMCDTQFWTLNILPKMPGLYCNTPNIDQLVIFTDPKGNIPPRRAAQGDYIKVLDEFQKWKELYRRSPEQFPGLADMYLVTFGQREGPANSAGHRFHWNYVYLDLPGQRGD